MYTHGRVLTDHSIRTVFPHWTLQEGSYHESDPLLEVTSWSCLSTFIIMARSLQTKATAHIESDNCRWLPEMREV